MLFDSWRITTDNETQLIRIEIPNLLGKRDNYTSDLQASSKKLPNRSRSRKEEERDTFSQEISLKKNAQKNTPNTEVTQAISHYSDEYLRIHGTKPYVNGASYKTFQALLKTRPIEQVNTLTTDYLSLADEKLRDKGYPIEWMPNHINRLLMAKKKPERGFAY